MLVQAQNREVVRQVKERREEGILPRIGKAHARDERTADHFSDGFRITKNLPEDQNQSCDKRQHEITYFIKFDIINILNTQKTYSFVLILWLAGFLVLTLGLKRQISEIFHNQDAIESLQTSLDKGAEESLRLSSETRAKARELETLLGLVNLLPQDKGFLRTQKVISDEVSTLRRKMSRWVGKDKVYILVDTKANKLYLKQGLNLLLDADCSVGRGGRLTDKVTGRTWEYVTPLGEFNVQRKIENPVWTKPDWAFVESKEPIPPPDDPSRKVEGELGAFLLSLGDGYLIHGTKNEAALGTAVSHGCVRLGADNLKKVYESVPVGTKVYIY